MGLGDHLRTARRLGWFDPALTGATAAALTRWGPTLAAPYAAGALRRPDRVAVVDHRRSLTYRELDHRSTALARGLRSSGLEAGDHLGVLCANHADFVEVSVAAAKAGLCTVYLNTGFAAPQLREVLRREGVRALVVDADLAVVADEADFDGTVLVADGETTQHRSLGDLRAVSASDRLLPSRPIAPVLLTSGTTGVPKGARRSGRPVDPSVALGMLERIPYVAGDVTVLPTPLFHAWGLTQLSIAAGTMSTAVLVPRFTPEATLAAVDENRATVLAVVPVMMQRILASDRLAESDTSALRIVASSGSALPAALALAWMDGVGDNLYNLYGSTEVGQATIATPNDLRAAPGTAGRVAPGSTVEIIDPSGVPVAAGAQGRIMVGSSAQFTEYTGGGTKDVVRGLMATGDVGYFDAAGRLFVTGRADDMIVSGGENVFPQEVEDLLLGHPDIADVGVVGVPDDQFGQRLIAWVVRSPGALIEADDVRAIVAGDLARHKVPRDVTFVETLPRNTTGKLLRQVMAAESPGSGL